MNLDQLTIEIRPRRAWEAIDLGLLMARRWWWPMLQVWLLVTLPLLALVLFLPTSWVWLSYALLWWLKPLFERPLLYILSQAVFDQAPATRTAMKAFWGLAWKQMILSVTWRRFSPSRSMDLAVVQLEDLRGQARSDRLRILHREDSTPSSWLTIISFAIEVFLAIGLAVLLYLLIPNEVNLNQEQIFSAEGLGWLVFLLCYYVAQALVAPFYVACGFSLYLNRRIKLEAWDIDIAFQRIVNKRRTPHSNPILAVILGLIVGATSFFQAPTATADATAESVEASTQNINIQAETQTPYTRASAKTTIDDVVSSDELLQKKLVRYPSFFDSDEKNKKNQDSDETGSDFVEWLLSLLSSGERMSSIASVLELLFWALIFCLIVVLIFRYRHWLASFLPTGSPQRLTRSKPVTLFGLDLTRESLPEDVSASALALWRNNDKRAALALLYRASLSRLLEAGLDIDQGHTEEECLIVAHHFAHNQPRVTSAINYFAQLTRAWQRLAYGHLSPTAEQAEQLCMQWNHIWQLDGETDRE